MIASTAIAAWRAYFALINVFSTKLAICAQIEIANDRIASIDRPLDRLPAFAANQLHSH